MKKNKVVEAEIVEEKDTSVNSVEEEEKCYFLPRLIAYILDIIIVALVSSFILAIIPTDKNYDKYVEEYKDIQTKCVEDMKNDSSVTSFDCIYRAKDVNYDIDRAAIPSTLVGLVLYIGYFIVFQAYNKGQTLGKKLMKIKVISTNKNDNKLNLNQVAIRAVIIDSIAINILMLGSVLFIGKDSYFYASLAIQGLSSLIVIVSLVMIFIRKDGKGLHDLAANTKVVVCK